MSPSTDDEIARFYDAHPYPPPIDGLHGEIERWADGRRRRIEGARTWPALPFRDDPSILVAGCGTSQAARYAARYPASRVVGIDVSRRALDATRALADRHALTNLELMERPVESATGLDEQFDLIVATGVIHHLVDPPAGLRALRDALTPSGALVLMVYGTYGRLGVAMIQEYCRRLGIEPAPAEIGDLVATLRELPVGHPLEHALRTARDFGDDAALADALLNPRERSYTVPQLFDLIGGAGLRFGRWVRQAPYRPECGSLSESPHRSRIAAMHDPDQFAEVELFRGTIARHTAITHRDDSPLPDPAVRFDGSGWLRFVPIRPTTTVVLEKRLPPGAAAAVINRAHTDPDLVCFLDARDRAAYEAIDGRATLAEVPEMSADLARRLWLHDLIVVDASR